MVLGIIFPHQCFAPVHIPESWDRILFVRHDIAYGGSHTTVRRFHIARHIYFRAIEAAWIDAMKKARGSVKIDVIDREAKWYVKGTAECFNPVDNMLAAEIRKHCPKIEIRDTPAFILTEAETIQMMPPSDKKASHATFYAAMRQKMDVLMTAAGKPVGGKWRFDTENRKAVGKGVKLPNWKKEIAARQSKYVAAAVKAVGVQKDSLGQWNGELIFPTTHAGAKDALRRFIRDRLNSFGPYEDAIVTEDNPLWHSVLSAPLNSGLLLPMDIIEAVEKTDAPLESKEGLIAQVLGWREYMRAVYLKYPTVPTNRLSHKENLTAAWYKGTTGLLPVDTAIQRVNAWGYLHHIERLMVVGNAMFLCKVDPYEVYRWFMEMFIDSFDWVMVGNVYYMSQWVSDAITTKPYISSSAYILRMSDYSRGEWMESWDALYWTTIDRHSDLLRKNYRIAAQVAFWNRKSAQEKKALHNNATIFLRNLKK